MRYALARENGSDSGDVSVCKMHESHDVSVARHLEHHGVFCSYGKVYSTRVILSILVSPDRCGCSVRLFPFL